VSRMGGSNSRRVADLRSSGRLLVWVISTLAVVAASGVFLVLQFADPAARGSIEVPTQLGRENAALTNAAGFAAAGCPQTAPAPPVAIELGPTFEGLARTQSTQECLKPPSDLRSVVSGPRIPVSHTLIVYGSCDPTGSDGCLPPLQIQSWPECARNPNSYRVSAGTPPLLETPVEGAETEPVELAPSIEMPSASLDGGRRLELYGGNTSVVIFAEDPSLAHRAAAVVAKTLTADSPTSASTLAADATAPGDGSSCADRASR
jgi:hypothetical protein